ncbi:hypothetical protein JKP88DRAFT_243856 [Tribonema minus]|uniref:Uncharacterized protein n=1 Tax=Tribonema minus TaxID=303371 RepID=A0A835Z800_9STRA|nr:hypothetical protein JKP88DRAFT_243856 [Tribonema minus]
MASLAVQIALESDFLLHVQPVWHPTTCLVCKEWNRAHAVQNVPRVMLPDTLDDLIDAVCQQMPLVSAAIKYVCRPALIEHLCQRDAIMYFDKLGELVHACFDSNQECFDEYYFQYAKRTWTMQHGFVAWLTYVMQPEQQYVMRQHETHAIIEAVMRLAEPALFKQLITIFKSAVSRDYKHYAFARAVIETECEDDGLASWALSVLDDDATSDDEYFMPS